MNATFCGDEGWTFQVGADGGLSFCMVEILVKMLPNIFGIVVALAMMLSRCCGRGDQTSYAKHRRQKCPLFWTYLKCTILFLQGVAFDGRFVSFSFIAEVHDYPLYLVISDLVNCLARTLLVVTVFQEMQRRVAHHPLLRVYFVLSWLASAVKLYNIVVSRSDPADGESPLIIYAVIFAADTLLASLSVLGGLSVGARRTLEFFVDDAELAEYRTQKAAHKAGLGEMWRVCLYDYAGRRLLWRPVVLLSLAVLSSAAKGALLQVVQSLWGKIYGDFAVSKFDDLTHYMLVLLGSYSAFALCATAAYALLGLAIAQMIDDPRQGLRVRTMQIRTSMRPDRPVPKGLEDGASFARSFDNLKEVWLTLDMLVEYFLCFVVGVGFMYQMSWELTTYILLLVPMAFLVTVAENDLLQEVMLEDEDSANQIDASARDLLSKLETSMIYGRTQTILGRWVSLVSHKYGTLRSRYGYGGLFNGSSVLANYLIYIVALLLAFNILREEGKDGAYLVEFFLITEYAISSIKDIVRNLPLILEKITRASSVLALAQMPSHPEDGDGDDGAVEREFQLTRAPSIVLHESLVGWGKPLGRTVVIESGWLVALVGPSGAGKSTLLRQIGKLNPIRGLGLITMYDGSADDSSASIDLSLWRHESYFRCLGFVNQHPDLFQPPLADPQLRENLAFGNLEASYAELRDTATWLKLERAFQQEERQDRAAQAEYYEESDGELVSFSDAEEATLLPRKRAAAASSAVVHRKAGGAREQVKLSGGQKQRVSIGRCKLKEPKLMLLDEISSALDRVSEKVIVDALNELRGTTRITVAHKLETITGADLILYMEDGAILEAGTHDQLMEMRMRYHAFFNGQDFEL